MKKVFYNGKVYTGELPLQEAFIVEDDRFLAVGSNEEILAIAGIDFESSMMEALSNEKSDLQAGQVTTEAYDEPVFLDLQGQFVCSGFNDSHMHLLSYGYMLHSVPMQDYTDSLEHLIAGTKAFILEHPVGEGQWIIGRGWNQDYFTDVKRMPDRYDLDRISREIPLCATRCCGHCLVVNSRALELLGITADSPSPEGGRIGMEKGQPDGRFYDNAMGIVQSQIPLPDKATIKSYIRSACKALNSYGVTSSQTDDYCVFRQLPWQLINEAYQELEGEGALTVRVYEQANFENLKDFSEFVAETEEIRKKEAENAFFKIGPLKMLGDGSLGARTAYLSQEYADAPGVTGIPIFTPKVFGEMIGYAHAHGMSAAVHAIGDACLDDVLDAMEAAMQRTDAYDREAMASGDQPEARLSCNFKTEDMPSETQPPRHGIVHCQITRPDQLERIAKLGLHIYAQSIFLDYDINIVEKRVGAERAASSYSWKSLMEKGIVVSNGSDCPVELPKALAGMQCAITRSTLADAKGEVKGPYLAREAFTVQEALDSFTIQGARASFEEAFKGRIAPGYLADFVLLGENLFEADPFAIASIPVREVYVGGKKHK